MIKEINGRNIHIWNDISLYNLTHPDESSLEVVLERGGDEYTVEIQPRQLEGDAYAKLGVVGGEAARTGF